MGLMMEPMLSRVDALVDWFRLWPCGLLLHVMYALRHLW